MSEKDKSILIRISEELSNEIKHWSQSSGHNKSSFVREAIKHYIDHLKSENSEVLELIRAIILTKLDKIHEEYDRGKIIAFTYMTPVSRSLNCNLCKDADNNEYIVYNIIQRIDESMLDAIDRYAQKLYKIWKTHSEYDRANFINDLQLDHVFFSMKTAEK